MNITVVFLLMQRFEFEMDLPEDGLEKIAEGYFAKFLEF